ncbi:MAG: hydrogenase maturation protease [Myxococcaceae bacterium]|jgi:hydrogenase maturation protease|nr:hydrogenase maturation protease [Myxococcaceae bacterium]MCA3012146.1 hydrogenase maturation protease [Myxococcaceae bacterium]
MTRPRVLVFGWGNPSRGDDGLGPAFVGEARRRDDVELIVDYQLQPEHALDLVGRDLVVFVDAALDAAEPFEVREVTPNPAASLTTHHLSPAALLHVFEGLTAQKAPRAKVLAIRGWQFQLGESLSERARRNLEAALEWWAADGLAECTGAAGSTP